jgi:hypothetical protein
LGGEATEEDIVECIAEGVKDAAQVFELVQDNEDYFFFCLEVEALIFNFMIDAGIDKARSRFELIESLEHAVEAARKLKKTFQKKRARKPDYNLDRFLGNLTLTLARVGIDRPKLITCLHRALAIVARRCRQAVEELEFTADERAAANRCIAHYYEGLSRRAIEKRVLRYFARDGKRATRTQNPQAG